MSKAENAEKKMRGSLNCFQAVFSTYSEDYGISEEVAIQMGELFGGGIMHEGSVCGAITGALALIGLHYNDSERKNKNKVEMIGKQFLEEFISLNNSHICRDLIGYDISSEAKLIHARGKNAFVNCPKFVYDAGKILESLFIND